MMSTSREYLGQLPAVPATEALRVRIPGARRQRASEESARVIGSKSAALAIRSARCNSAPSTEVTIIAAARARLGLGNSTRLEIPSADATLSTASIASGAPWLWK